MDHEDAPDTPQPSPASTTTAVLDPTNLLMERLRATCKRTLTRSLSPAAESGCSPEEHTASAMQGLQTDLTAGAGDGAPKYPAAAAAGAEALGKDINTTLELFLTHISDVETGLDEMTESSILLVENIDAAVNLIQETLLHIALMGEKL